MFGVACLSASRKGTDVPCVCCKIFIPSFLLTCIVFLLKMLSQLLWAKPCMNRRADSLLLREGDPSISGNLTVAEVYGDKWLVAFQDLV